MIIGAATVSSLVDLSPSQKCKFHLFEPSGSSVVSRMIYKVIVNRFEKWRNFMKLASFDVFYAESSKTDQNS